MNRLIIVPVRKIAKHEVSRFLIVGGFSFLIEFSLFTFLVDLLAINYIYANLPAMGVSIMCNYFLTRRLVFKSERYNNKISFLLFVIVTLIGVILNQFLLWYLFEQLALNIKLSKFLAVGCVAVFSYFSKKHLVF